MGNVQGKGQTDGLKSLLLILVAGTTGPTLRDSTEFWEDASQLTKV